MQKLEQSRRKTQKHAKNIEKQHPNGGSCSKLFSRSFLNHQKRKQRTTSPAKFADKRAKRLCRGSQTSNHINGRHTAKTRQNAPNVRNAQRIRAYAHWPGRWREKSNTIKMVMLTNFYFFRPRYAYTRTRTRPNVYVYKYERVYKKNKKNREKIKIFLFIL